MGSLLAYKVQLQPVTNKHRSANIKAGPYK